MAEEVIKIELGGSGGNAKSLQDLKKDYADLGKELSKTKAGSDAYYATLKKLGTVKDDMNDLRTTINALNPEGKVAAFAKMGSTIASGFAAAQGAAALFGSESEELQKTMMKVQAAMALAEGIKGIAAAGDAFAVMGTIIKTNVVTALTTLKGAIMATGLGALAVAIGVLINETMKYNEAIEEEFDKQRKLNEELKKTTDGYLEQAKASEELRAMKKGGLNELERELKLLESSGATAEQVYNKKKEILQAELFDIGVKFKTVEGDEAAQIKLRELGRDKRNEIAALEASYAKGIRDKDLEEYKQANKDKQDSDKEKAKEFEKYEKEMDDYRRQINADYDRDLHQKALDDRKVLETKKEEDKAFDDEELNASFNKVNKEADDTEAAEKRKQEAKQKTFNDTINGTKQALQQTQALTDMFFAYQLKKNKGNAAAELEIRKKQFKVNKAFGIVNAVVDGVGAVQKALNNPYPLNLILAVLSGVLAAANVAKIASSKFEGGESGGGGGDIGSVGSPTVPAIPQPNNTVTKIDDDGKVDKGPPVVKAIVVESDMTEKQQRVNTIQESAKFG